jgi:hypothetical protein
LATDWAGLADSFLDAGETAGFADFVLLEEDGVTGLTLLLSGDNFLVLEVLGDVLRGLVLEVLEDVLRGFACLTDLFASAFTTFFVAVFLFAEAFGGVTDFFGGVTDLRVFCMVEGMISK